MIRIFHQLADSGAGGCDHHDVVGSPPSLSVYVMEHGRIWLPPAVTGYSADPRTCPAGGITTTADYGHSRSLGDSEHIYRLMIIARKSRCIEKSPLRVSRLKD